MPRRAAALRLSIALGPLGGSFAVANVVARWLGRPDGMASTIWWWLAVLGSSAVSLGVLERIFRRLLPLQALLDLSMAFPGPAPKRLRVARKAGDVDSLKKQFARMARGTAQDASAAAETVLSLVAALGSHDRRTRGHSERVRVYADLLAESLGLPVAARDRLRWAALLHDIGKLEVAAEVLNKPDKPDEDEWQAIARHPELGAQFAAPLRSWLGEWASAIEHHHERFDGEGYPSRLAGEEISLGGRIVAVADSFETMTAARPYKKPMRVNAAREELVRCAGTHFDPVVVRAFLNISIRRIRIAAGLVPALFQMPFVGPLAPMVPRTVIGALAVVGGSLITNPLPPDRPLARPAIAAPAPRGESDLPGRQVVAGDSQPEPTPTAQPNESPEPTPTATPSDDPAGDPPSARNDSTSTREDRAKNVDVLANDSDPDGDLDRDSMTVVQAPRHGIALQAAGQTLRYVPVPNFNGTDSFTYRICDENGACSTATVTVDVFATRDPPIAVDDGATTVAVLPVTIQVDANDSDPDGDLDGRSVAVTEPPAHGTATVNGNGSITYVASLLFSGVDTFEYEICDLEGSCATATVSVSVVP